MRAGTGDKRFAVTWLRSVMNSNLPSTTKLVMAGLVTFMDADGSNCFPSEGQIAKRCSINKRTVIPHLRKAAAAGFIRVHNAGETGQGWRRHGYVPVIVVNKIHHDPEGGESLAEGGESDDRKVVNDVHPTYPSSTYPKDLARVGAREEEKIWIQIKEGDPGWEPWLWRIRKHYGPAKAEDACRAKCIEVPSEFPPAEEVA